jgi:ketosteroid isomerase-like protein
VEILVNASRAASAAATAEAREYYRRWAAAWSEWDWEIEDVRERDDVVVTRTWVTGRGRGSGLVLDMRVGQVWTFRDGKVVRYEALPSWEDALAAAGIPSTITRDDPS